MLGNLTVERKLYNGVGKFNPEKLGNFTPDLTTCQWVKEIVKTEREKRNLPLEAKKLNNNYYLYHSTTRWDKKEKKSRNSQTISGE